ncbi:MAG TPA: hypothetical protein VJO34_13140 [Methylomirabilota bacterium]|nr:hypothetical protein [Methylomirabilota bacterium]
MDNKVVVICKDLFFTSRIGETAKLVGTSVEFARQPDELADKLIDSTPRLVIVDLTTQGWEYEEIFHALENQQARAPILGFTTHALAKTTQPWHSRCDRVVTKETFTQELPEILRSDRSRGTPSSGLG